MLFSPSPSIFLRSGILVLAILILAGCSSTDGLQKANTSYWYKPSELTIRPHFIITHLNDSISTIRYRIATEDLLYIRNSGNDNYEASATLEYEVLPSIDRLTAVDSGRIAVTDKHSRPRQINLAGEFTIKTPPTEKIKSYLLRVRTTDDYRSASFENFLKFKRGQENSAENFYITDPEGRKIYKNHLPIGVPFKLHHRNSRNQKVYVSFYQRNFPLALPPYAEAPNNTFELDPDSLYMAPLAANLALGEKGYYHFRLDTGQWEGFSLYSFYREFPEVATPENLAGPLRYLTTQKEWDELQSLAGKPEKIKLWVDEFWLQRAGSKARARKLIAAYYNRVEQANYYFTSFLEGWKSDRGIIYIIYGPPDKVFTTVNGEDWIYGSESSSLPYIFKFGKVNNPFTDNDYEMQRSQSYRYGWGQAISSWRSGNVYNSQDIKREQNEQDQYQYNTRYPVWY